MRVGLCIPCYDGKVHDQTMSSVTSTMREAAKRGIEIHLIMCRGLGVLPHARNWLVSQALNVGCDKVWFADSDIAWDHSVPEVINMISAPADIVAGVPQARNNFWNDPARLIVHWDKIPPEQDEATGLPIVKKVATAFMCIDRSVFERIKAAGLARPYVCFGSGNFQPDSSMAHLRAYFWYDFLPFNGLSDEHAKQLTELGCEEPFVVMQGEDYYFCDRARAAGATVLVDPRVKLIHFDGCVQHNVTLENVRFETGKEQ